MSSWCDWNAGYTKSRQVSLGWRCCCKTLWASALEQTVPIRGIPPPKDNSMRSILTSVLCYLEPRHAGGGCVRSASNGTWNFRYALQKYVWGSACTRVLHNHVNKHRYRIWCRLNITADTAVIWIIVIPLQQ